MEHSPFSSQTQLLQYYSKYSRWDEEKKRRENWKETVDRTVGFFKEGVKKKYNGSLVLSDETWNKLEEYLFELKSLTSMRSLQMAGLPAERCNVCIYNCAALPIQDLFAFSELLYILMQGTGCSFSVEKYFVNQLPVIKEKQFPQCMSYHFIKDSTEGWCDALKIGLETWFDGQDITFDYSGIRKEGSVLKTKGGRASGSKPLKELLEYTRKIILENQGKQLRPIQCHDICCHIARIVELGGVRRCLGSNTRISTTKGMTKIKDISVGDEVLTLTGSYEKVTNKFVQGKQQLLNLKLENGQIFSCTGNHKVAVLRDCFGDYEYVEAQHLLPNDRMMLVTHACDGEIQKSEPSGNFNPEWNIETAWVLGKFLADGYVGTWNTSLAFHSSERKQGTRYEKWLRKYGITPIKNQVPLKKAFLINTGKQDVVKWFLRYKTAKTSIIIPDEIWKSPKEVRESFIAGVYDGDGCNHNPLQPCASIYPDFIKQLQILLNSVGVVSHFVQSGKPKNNWKAMWAVHIKQYTSKLRFKEISEKYGTKDVTATEKQRYGLTVPLSFVLRDLKRIQYKTIFCPEKGADMSAERCFNITGFKDAVPVKVISIEEGIEEETFDIEVNNVNHFVAEGFLVHNSACLSHSDLHDNEMRMAKWGTDWQEKEHQRWQANNSVIYSEKPSYEDFCGEWENIKTSGSGERGILNRRTVLPERRNKIAMYCFNPCSEIVLRPFEFCNLTIAVARKNDTLQDLIEKVRMATIWGTIQSLFTDFNYLRPEWKKNCEEERLLGVDIINQMGCELIQPKSPHKVETIKILKEVAVGTNKIYSELFSINQSVAVTCIKPAGNSSEFLNVSTKPYHSEYFLRRFSLGKLDPIANLLHSEGVPGTFNKKRNVWLFEFPMKSPEGATLINGISAIEQFENWLDWRIHYTEHNPSVSIYVKEHEWDILREKVWENWDYIGGLSFFPYSDSVYENPPFESITKEEYEERLKNIPDINWERLSEFEDRDNTTGAREYACVSGECKI